MFNCRTQLIISLSNRDRVSKRSLVVVGETNIAFHTSFFSRFQSLSFGNIMGWKCSLKDNCIRSSLIECQSFSNRKFHPKYRVLVPLPCTVHVSRSTWYREVNILRIFMIFVSWIYWQKEYCLSSAQILTSRYQSIVDDMRDNKSSVLSGELGSPENGTFFLSSCTPITSCAISSRTDLSRIGFRTGWFDWKLLDSCPTSGR